MKKGVSKAPSTTPSGSIKTLPAVDLLRVTKMYGVIIMLKKARKNGYRSSPSRRIPKVFQNYTQQVGSSTNWALL